MAYLKNGVRSALAIYMAEIRPLLGFGGWNVRFWRQTEGIRESGPIIGFRTQKFVKKPQMAYLKNGVWSALAIYMAEIRPLLGFGGWNVRFLDLEAETCDPTHRAKLQFPDQKIFP